jgi:3',5'-cyclic AMP phosphodiesterase CpdA
MSENTNNQKLTWLHLSDIHFHPKLEWRDRAIQDSLIQYLKSAFDQDIPKPDFIFCTGDIAFGEAASAPIANQYNQASEFFDRLREVCGNRGNPFSSEKMFLVPGNHDVNRKSVNGDAQTTMINWAQDSRDRVATINQRFNDKTREFKDTISRLAEYEQFIAKHFPHQADAEGRLVYARKVECDGITVGVCGFNSAWSCAGPEDDRNLWMAADWQFNFATEALAGADVRIGLMHHPVDWLNVADREIATRRITSEFDFWLHGHEHSSWVVANQSNVLIGAGAVGAENMDEFGVNVVSLDLRQSRGTVYLHRKGSKTNDWTIEPIPQHAPNGQWRFSLPTRFHAVVSRLYSVQPLHAEVKGSVEGKHSSNVLVARYLQKRLDDALLSFGAHRSDWIPPILSTENELSQDAKQAVKIDASELISNPKSVVVSAPPQYGQTCLAHYLVTQAWNSPESSFWLYLDAKQLKPNAPSVTKAVEEELQVVGMEHEDIKCVVVDSWTGKEKDDIKIFKLICDKFSTIPVICMQQSDGAVFATDIDSAIGRKFDLLNLWALSREQIRKIVASYNNKRHIGEEDVVTTRIIADLEVLNLHRTPLNCLTLLKVSEIDFDESPVNRSEMIKRVLFLLFNIDDVPTYKTRPDLKDCEYVLGYFCEHLIRDGAYSFSRDQFLLRIQQCSNERLIDLETQVVFDILFSNNIIVRRGLFFEFRFSYWIFYFAAQRMHHDEDFARFILSEMRYAQHPELIEFYTGIDRRREDALRILISDLRDVFGKVKENVGFPEKFNPYRLAKWEASPEAQDSMESEIENGVRESNLPAEIKDQYADRTYDRARPYDQRVQGVLTSYAFGRMMQGVRAAARALRNSDYVTPEIKRELLTEILKCWDLITKVLFILLPTLAQDETAVYDGTRFVLAQNFGDTVKKRAINILQAIPFSIASMFEDDLFSMKMGPLLVDQLRRNSASELSAHELMILLIRKRPRNWTNEVDRYISTLPRNSFFLLDVYRTLRGQYRYSFASNQTLAEIERLIKMAAVKHVSGIKSPGAKLIKRTKLRANVIPTRQVSEISYATIPSRACPERDGAGNADIQFRFLIREEPWRPPSRGWLDRRMAVAPSKRPSLLHRRDGQVWVGQ